MKNLLFPLTLAALLAPGAAAQSPFEGTWKIDLSTTEFSPKPDEYLLQNGIYTCKTCNNLTGPIKADGTDQPVPGYPYADTVAIKVVDDHQVHRTSKKDGKVVGESTSTISSDGKTLTEDFYFVPGTAAPVKGNTVSQRVANGPPGSHAISGSWRAQKMSMSDNGRLFTYRIKGDQITMSSPMSDTYTAKLDGTEAPYKGDPDITSVRVKIISSDTLEETFLHGGQIIYVSRTTVAPDGKKAKIVNEDKRQNTTSSFEAAKQ